MGNLTSNEVVLPSQPAKSVPRNRESAHNKISTESDGLPVYLPSYKKSGVKKSLKQRYLSMSRFFLIANSKMY